MSNNNSNNHDDDHRNDSNNAIMFVDATSTLTLLEHINLNVPNHQYILDFYIHILGMGLDPRRASNVAKGEGTVWCNCGASQFHLPFGEEAQTIPGVIGLWYDDNALEPLKHRLEQYNDSQHSLTKPFASYSVEKDDVHGDIQLIQIQDWYGNVFHCRKGSNPIPIPSPSSSSVDGNRIMKEEVMRTAQQPVLKKTPQMALEFGQHITDTYGITQDSTECKGISYVEFYIPKNRAALMAEFYECVLDATTSVITDPNTGDQVAIIAFGHIDLETGRSSQALLFRETDDDIPNYDGHHIALYVGENASDFEQAFKNVQDAGVLWVNPRFSDKVVNLNTAKKWKQFRFKDIVELETGRTIFQLEHECRSRDHEAWPGKS